MRRIVESLKRVRRFLTRDIWRMGVPGKEVRCGFIIRQIRVIMLLIRGIVGETLLLRASALTFATLLFIVPFTVFMFYFIQTFNLGDEVYRRVWVRLDAHLSQVIRLVQQEDERPSEGLEPTEGAARTQPAHQEMAGTPHENNAALQQRILTTLFPIFPPDQVLVDGAAGRNPVKILFDLAHERVMNPQAVGAAGVLFVLCTVFGFLRNIESSFNGIWGVKRSRNRLRRISGYVIVTLLLPFVAAGVLGINAALESGYAASVFGLFGVAVRGVQFAVVCLTFSLLYCLVPNTKVQFRYALLGGVIAGLLWILTSWAYVRFQYGLARYALFFSTFALFPFLLMWVYLSWVILLFGALVAYAYQNEKTFTIERLADKGGN